MAIWTRCRDSWGNTLWPDGGAYLDQPLRLVAAWDIIGREWPKYDRKG